MTSTQQYFLRYLLQKYKINKINYTIFILASIYDYSINIFSYTNILDKKYFSCVLYKYKIDALKVFLLTKLTYLLKTSLTKYVKFKDILNQQKTLLLHLISCKIAIDTIRSFRSELFITNHGWYIKQIKQWVCQIEPYIKVLL